MSFFFLFSSSIVSVFTPSSCSTARGRLIEVDINTDAGLREVYGIRILVVALPNGEEKGWPFTAAQIARMLDGEGSA